MPKPIASFTVGQFVRLGVSQGPWYDVLQERFPLELDGRKKECSVLPGSVEHRIQIQIEHGLSLGSIALFPLKK